jgi:hypothetical protein
MHNAVAGQEFAQWLGETHPQVYQAVFAHTMRRGLHGLGDDTTDDGSDFSDPTLQDVSVDTDNLDYVVGSSESDVADALPLFDTPLNSAGGGISTSAGPSSTTGIPAQTAVVASTVSTPAMATAVAQLGTAVLTAIAAPQIAAAQAQVLQANAQRAAAGQSPIPISYVTGANGQLVPVYNTGTGTSILPTSLQQSIAAGTSVPITLPTGETGYTLTSNTLSSLLGSNSIWLVLGAIALGLLMLEQS